MDAQPYKLVIAAGGTGGHIFPALAVAQAWKQRFPESPIIWIGTTRSREAELCAANNIPLVTLDVTGVKRKLSLQAVGALFSFIKACGAMIGFMRAERPTAVLAFGGYVSAPVLLAARLEHAAYFIHEQNTVPGAVNRFFSDAAVTAFLGKPLNVRWKLNGTSTFTGMPVRTATGPYTAECYPSGIDKSKKTVLISGGSQGALTMNRMILDVVTGWIRDGIQVVWQTGDTAFDEIALKLKEKKGVFLFKNIPDLYPFYAISRVVVGRAGASTLAECAYFGLPCIAVPLPWSAENHQWTNAGCIETQGWGLRVRQDTECGVQIDRFVRSILGDDSQFEKMSRKALDNSPAQAATTIVTEIATALEGSRA